MGVNIQNHTAFVYYRLFRACGRFSISSLLRRRSVVQSDVLLFICIVHICTCIIIGNERSLNHYWISQWYLLRQKKFDGLINSRFEQNSTDFLLSINVFQFAYDEYASDAMNFLETASNRETSNTGENDTLAAEFTFRDERSYDRSFPRAGHIPLIRCSNQFRKDFISGGDITSSPCTNGMEHPGQEKSRWFEKPPSEIASASRCSIVLRRNSGALSPLYFCSLVFCRIR